jgi:hypothetical protein
MQPAAAPPAPVVSPEPIKPSGWWYGVAAAIGVAGIVIAIVVLVATISGLVDRVDDFQRFSLPGEGAVTIEEPGGYSVYHEFPGAAADSRPGSLLSVRITGPDGAEVPLGSVGVSVPASSAGSSARWPSAWVDRSSAASSPSSWRSSAVPTAAGAWSPVGSDRPRPAAAGLAPPGRAPAAVNPARPASYPPAPPPAQPPGPYAPPQPPPGESPPGNMQPPPGLPPT